MIKDYEEKPRRVNLKGNIWWKVSPTTWNSPLPTFLRDDENKEEDG